MGSLRRFARKYRDLAKQHVDDPDVPAAPDGVSGYAEWVQIGLILFRVELEKSLRETEDYLNEMPDVLAVFGLDEEREHLVSTALRAPPPTDRIDDRSKRDCQRPVQNLSTYERSDRVSVASSSIVDVWLSLSSIPTTP